MIKFLGILALGLFLTSNSFAQVIKYECKMPAYPKIEYVNYEFDFGSKFMAAKYVFDGNYSSEKHIILEVDNQKVFLKNQKSKVTWYFNYATDQRGHTMSQGPDISHNCRYDKNLVKAAINKLNNLSSSSSSSQSAGISFTIKDKKEQCTAIGFKPATDKFADCVLRLVELDLKRQVNDSSMTSQSSADQQIANEIKKQNNLRQSQFLMNLSQQLLNPSSPASSMSTSSCTVRGGTIKTINCW